jgi:type II secretory pathway component PulJ
MKKTSFSNRRHSSGHAVRAGFSLVEVTLALGIAAFCLVTLFGLMPVGISSNQTSVEQTFAAGVAGRVAADLRNTPPPAGGATSATSSLGFAIPGPGGAASANPQILYFTEAGNPSGLIGAQPVTSGSTESRYRATVGFTPKNGITTARILVTWPALADKANLNWPKIYSGSFEAFTALDRNQ